MNETIAEALSAVEGKIETAPEKIPTGAAIIGITLSRDPGKSGKHTTAVSFDWISSGMAVAIKDGHVIRANHIFGRFSDGTPKVTACHIVTCRNCAKTVLMPQAVWEAKDAARKRGIEVPDDVPGIRVLEEHGRCSCGGQWFVDKDAEKAELTGFADQVLRAISDMPGPVPAFIPPRVFAVTQAGTTVKTLPPEWTWLSEAVTRQGKVVSFYEKGAKGDLLMFNPGFWVGHIFDVDSTNLFWVENGKGRPNVPRNHFNPFGVEGL